MLPASTHTKKQPNATEGPGKMPRRKLTREVATAPSSSGKRLHADEDDGPASDGQGPVRKRPRLSKKIGAKDDAKNGMLPLTPLIHNPIDNMGSPSLLSDQDSKGVLAHGGRRADKKLLANLDKNHWVLQEDVAVKALQALGEIAHLPSFSSTPSRDITLTRPEENSYMATLGAFDISCTHPLLLSNDCLAYGGCGVLTFLDLYWCPLLGCLVSPQAGSILIYKEFHRYVLDYHVPHDHSPESLVLHVKNAFNIDPSADLPSLFEGLRHIAVQHPIPGLHVAEKRYQCPDCRQWYSSYRNHVKKSKSCRQSKESKHFSIPLYPPSNGIAMASLGTDYRIRLVIPDHRDLSPIVKINKRLCRRSEVKKLSLPAQDLEEMSDTELINSWLDPRFSNGTGPQAPKLQKSDLGFHFVRRGQSFHCQHHGTLPRSDFSTYSGCAALSFFQLYYSPVLGAVVSPSRMTLLCRDTLLKVISSRVHGIDNQTLLDHITKSFHLLDNVEDMFASMHRNLLLNTPILGLPDPKLVFQCKYCGCSVSHSRSLKHFSQHLSDSHPGDEKIAPIRTYAIRLWNTNAKCRYQAIMSDSWIAGQSAPMTDHGRTQVLSYSKANAVHLKGSGLQHHFESWGAKPASLISFISICPDLQSWSVGRMAWKMERCIEQIHRLAGDYLSDAERRLENSPYLRRAVTGLHSNPTKFHPLTKDTLSSHRCSLTRLFALTLRATIITIGNQFKDKADKAHFTNFTQQIGSFQPLLSVDQATAVQGLASEINGQEGILPDDRVLAFMHTFLLDIFTHAYPVTQEVSSILEQAIIIQCLTEDVNQPWRSATWTYAVISMHFRLAKVVLVQAAILGGRDAPYKQLPPVLGQPTPDLAEEAEEPEVMNGPDMGDTMLLSLLGEEPEMDMSDEEEGRPGGDAQPFNLVLNNLRILSRMVNPIDRSCLYGRLSSLREIVQITARSEPLSSRVTWHDDGQQFSLSWAFIQERPFNLPDIRITTFLAVERLNEACQQLFPADIWESLSLLSIGSFVDNWEDTSMFDQNHNKEHLSPMIERLQHHFTQALDRKGDTLSSIIERSRTFLASFAVALYLTTIPPYAYQAVELKYANDGVSDRNFKLMDGRHGVFLWHPGRGGHTGYEKKGSDSAWFIPPQVALPLIIYLGIVRPVEIHFVAAHALRSKINMDLKLLQTHIFCDPLRKASAKSILWSPDGLDDVLKSGPLKMEAFPHRLVLSAIVVRKHTELVQIMEQPSVIDAQGQHTSKTSQMCYAVLQLQHTNNAHISGYIKQLLACQALHASCFLEKPVASLTSTAECTLDATIHQNQSFAFNTARDMVATRYKLAMSSRERVAVLSRIAYVNVPFLSRSPLPGCKQGGGDELSHVIVALAFATAIREDCSIQVHSIAYLMASASTLMLAALSEWFSGELVPYTGNVSLFHGKWRDLMVSFLIELRSLSEVQLTDWVVYIRDLSSALRADGAVALPLPTSL